MEVISILTSSIFVPVSRQREELGDIQELANSISTNGQLQAIIVDKDADFDDDNPRYVLVAGERRWRAHQLLKKETIFASLFSGLSQRERELIELDENIRRKQLEWPEYVLAVARYARLCEGDSQAETAQKLGLAPATLSRICKVALALGPNPKLKLASSWTAAHTALVDQEKKATDSLVEDILAGDLHVDVEAPVSSDVSSTEPTNHPNVSSPSLPADIEVHDLSLSDVLPTNEVGRVRVPPGPRALTGLAFAYQADFREWLVGYQGKRFNLIHCDFPYGLNMDTANLQGSAVRWDATDGRYADSPELFDDLCKHFFEHQDKFVAESAHVIFWIAHKHFGKLWSRFKYFGWDPCEVPLIWHKSDGAGIAPDVRRQPRRTYEIAIFASRGDRKIVKVKAASVAAPTTKEHHLSEKPMAVVSHFLEMLVDGTTEILDPTCGSGTALEAAANLGARHIVGLDVLPQHVAFSHNRVARALTARSNDPLDSIIGGVVADAGGS